MLNGAVSISGLEHRLRTVEVMARSNDAGIRGISKGVLMDSMDFKPAESVNNGNPHGSLKEHEEDPAN